MKSMLRTLASITLTLTIAASTARAGSGYFQTNLVSDNSNVVKAQVYDPNLINPWGVAFTATSPLWVSDQGSGVAIGLQDYGQHRHSPVAGPRDPERG